MPDEPAPASAPARPRALGIEALVVFLIALALLLPGIWRYSLVDPWETHYGEVGRRMLAGGDTVTGHWQDWVHTEWQNEGFRSKPVLTFWLDAASLRAFGLAEGGGYSGELEDQAPRTTLAIRLPFVLLAAMGLVLTWWMLARLVNRRAAWLAFLVVATTPFFALVARQAITDMPMVALVMGALACFLLADAGGDAPASRLGRRAFAAIAGGFVGVQAVYYLVYFQLARFPVTGVLRLPQPGWWFFLTMIAGLAYVLAPRIYTELKATLLWLVALALGRPDPRGFALRWGEPSLLAYPLTLPIIPFVAAFREREPVLAHAFALARRATRLDPLTRGGQLYILWFWVLIATSVLAKGLPGIGVAGVTCAAYVVFHRRWRALARGDFELKRGVVLLALVILPWHLAMYMRDGQAFVRAWIYQHNFDRAATTIEGERASFPYYIAQLGYGMFVWAGLVPMALAAAALVRSPDRAAARVRFLIATWALAAIATFCLAETKYHHYILPAIPALGILVGLWLDDLLAGRVRPSLAIAAFGAGVVLLLARDLMWDEKIWINMFMFEYKRGWPTLPPWSIDTSDAFLGLGVLGAAGVLGLGTRFRRAAVAGVAVAALGVAAWAMHVYMPIAGTHWGMREQIHRYYDERQIYGARLLYYSPRSFHDEWAARDHWDLDTFVPAAFQDGQPMTVAIEVEGMARETRFRIRGTARRAGPHTLRIALDRGELAPVTAAARAAARGRYGRRPTRVVDADRLLAWQLYWRGENFWTADEIWGPVPEMKTVFKDLDSVGFLRYLNDRTLAPEGRRYFVITESIRTATLAGILPTETARDTFEILDTTSNKYSLCVFQL